MKTFSIQAYCPKCRKTSWLEIDNEEFQGHIVAQSGIPTPRMATSSGLVRRSLSHGDHILLLEIDRNGVVRKESVVELISSMIENIVARTVERVLFLKYAQNQKELRLLYISHAVSFQDFFKSVVSILMLNLGNSVNFSVEVDQGFVSIRHMNLQMVLAPLSDAVKMIKTKEINSIVIDIDSIPEVELISALQRVNLQDSNIILAYNSRRHGETPTTLLNFLLERGLVCVSLLDYSTAQGLSNIIEASFNNMPVLLVEDI